MLQPVEPDVTGLPAAIVPRVRRTVACRDSDRLPKVDGAGTTTEVDGVLVQTMASGVRVVAGGYFGEWMARIIEGLQGHHEPQEEVVFDAVLARLAADSPAAPTMIEPGCFWAYYSVWFASRFPTGRVLAIEPDPANLEVGRRNAALNGVADRIEFREGIVGPRPGARMPFTSETTGEPLEPVQYDLAALLAASGAASVDLVVCDIQGAETALLSGGIDLLKAGRVRFLIVSTHHHAISGDPLTHRTVLSLLQDAGAHVIAEHTVAESASGDGLVAVSFDPRDTDLTVEVSHARADDAILPLLETDLALAWAERDALRAQLLAWQEQAAAAAREADATQEELAALRATAAWRLTRRPAELLHRARRRGGEG